MNGSGKTVVLRLYEFALIKSMRAIPIHKSFALFGRSQVLRCGHL